MEKKWHGSVWAILITELAGLLSSLLSGNIGGHYQNIVKPPLSPPGWIFGPVWVILYAMIGYAAYRVWTKNKKALIPYFMQLAINLLWPIVFFRFSAYWLAFIAILILDVLAIITTFIFYRQDKVSGWLMIPYILWLLFATYLNYGVALLN